MRLVWHIFRKDSRRLRWEIAMMLLLIGGLAYIDLRRLDALPGGVETWLRVLVAVGWAYLLTMAVHQEALVGDRQFWITRPYPRLALASAKGLFALAYVHAPLFAADCVVLASHGISPLGSIGVLLWRQVLVAVFVTLPVAALAAVTGGLAEFVAAAVAICGLAMLSFWLAEPPPVDEIITLRMGIAILAVGLGAVIALVAQYRLRRTALARAALAAFAALGAIAGAFLSSTAVFSVGMAFHEPLDADKISVVARMDWEAAGITPVPLGVNIPVHFQGLSNGISVSPLFELTVFTATGKHWPAGLAAGAPLRAEVILKSCEDAWLHLSFSRSLFDRLAGKKVSIVGRLAAFGYFSGAPARTSTIFTPFQAAGVGRCSSTIAHPDFGTAVVRTARGAGDDIFVVTCESAGALPPFTGLTLLHRPTGRTWQSALGDGGLWGGSSPLSWLSPLSRQQAIFYLTADEKSPDLVWKVPRKFLNDSDVVLFPVRETGRAMLRFELRDVDLREFLQQPSPRHSG